MGDAILGAVVCELLFRQYPDYLEGDLTKIKSVVVSRQTCAKISEALGLQEFLVVGKGMTTNPTVPPSLLADVFESLVAAIYLDGGDAGARGFIERFLGPEIELAATGELGGNYKSLLQQLAQREVGSTPTYQLLDEKGPRPQQVLQGVGPDRADALPAGLGPQQEGSRTARGPQCLGRAQSRAGAVPVGLSCAVHCRMHNLRRLALIHLPSVLLWRCCKPPPFKIEMPGWEPGHFFLVVSVSREGSEERWLAKSIA